MLGLFLIGGRLPNTPADAVQASQAVAIRIVEIHEAIHGIVCFVSERHVHCLLADGAPPVGHLATDLADAAILDVLHSCHVPPEAAQVAIVGTSGENGFCQQQL